MPPPTVNRYNPGNAEPGTRIEVYGTDFIMGKTRVTFTGGVQGELVDVTDYATLEVDVPEGARTGPVTVATPGGSGVGPSFTVDYPAVRIRRFQPERGGSNTRVQITGDGFNGGTGVKFGTQESWDVRWESNVRVTAAVPNGARPGRVRIEVIVGDVIARSAKEFVIE